MWSYRGEGFGAPGLWECFGGVYLDPKLGMFPLILTVLTGDYNRGNYSLLKDCSYKGNIPTLGPKPLGAVSRFRFFGGYKFRVLRF